MKILYICRIFSGLERSLNEGKWQPTGAPTIYRMIEALDVSEHDVRFVMTGKGVGDSYRCGWNGQKVSRINLEGLRNPVHVLPDERKLPLWLGRGRGYVNLFLQVWLLWFEVKRFKPDLVYVDRSNLILGALIARFMKISVLLRVMGVYPSMWDVLNSRHPFHYLQRWAYRSPFRYVICTQDGSGGEAWMKAALGHSVMRKVMLNGVDYEQILGADTLPEALRGLRDGRLIVLFVGRLEGIKGCKEFIEALLLLYPKYSQQIHGLVVGMGSLGGELIERVRKAGADTMVTFIERLPHKQISRLHKYADVYVSLNKLGNLSNANLEAMAAGACMILPEASAVNGVDVATNELVPLGSVIRINNENQVVELAKSIVRLLNHPMERTTLRKNISKAAQNFLPDWERRIREELQILEEITPRE